MSAIEELITELARLPGIGRKTAQRLTFHLLQQSPEQAQRLASVLTSVSERVRPCEECGNLTEEQPCGICRDPRRDGGLVCVVEEPSTVGVVDRSTDFRGHYHVLGGRLSPLDGIGPEALRLDRLVQRVRDGGVREVILATNPPWRARSPPPTFSSCWPGWTSGSPGWPAGCPMGGDLEYVDGVTLAHALVARQDLG